MTSQSEWLSKDDLEKDLWYYSEISDGNRDTIQEPPSASILQWRAQVSSDRSSSVFDNPHYSNEDVTYVCSGRGRGGVSKIFRPGLPVRDQGMMEEDYIGRKLREVSGLGYSNELIENVIKAKNNTAATNEAREFADAERSPSSSSPRGRCGSPTPGRSQDRSATASPRMPTVSHEDKPKTPPPLSVILGKKRTNKNLAKKEELVPARLDAVEARSDTKSSVASVGSCSPRRVEEEEEEAAASPNDYRWSNGAAPSSGSSDDSPSWRSGPRGSPGSFDATHWRRDFGRRENRFDIRSAADFPAL